MRRMLKLNLLYHLIDLLRDGRYRFFSEIMTQLKSLHASDSLTETRHKNEEAVKCVIAFLEKFGFVERLKQRRTLSRTWKVRLTPSMLQFLNEIEDLENEELQAAKISIAKEETVYEI